MSDNIYPQYFLCAAGKNGFVSEMRNVYSAVDGWRAYIIKGGPGTGKSTLMKKLAARLSSNGEAVELIPCTGDPASIDAVILPQKRIMVFDGTAPHVVEPEYVGVCERIVNVGDCIDGEKLIPFRCEIIDLFKICSLIHARAGFYISSAAGMFDGIEKMTEKYVDTAKTAAFARSLAQRNIPKKSNNKGSEQVRFLSGTTLLGYTFFDSTLENSCDEIITVSDDNGVVSRIMMNEIAEVATGRGYDIIRCCCPLLPDKTDHVIIPELRIAFCTETKEMKPPTPIRKIHARRFTDSAGLRKCRQKIAFNRKAAAELLLEAKNLLCEAKEFHDSLEAYYISSVDFKRVEKIGDELYKKIKSEIR